MNATIPLKETGRRDLSGETRTFVAIERKWHGPDGWQLVADRRQVFPNDPGQGTPLMVYSPLGTASGTLNRVLDTAETDTNNGRLLPVPGKVMAWLENTADDAQDWVFA